MARLTGAGFATISIRRAAAFGTTLNSMDWKFTISASGTTLYARFGRPSKAPGSSGGSENAPASIDHVADHLQPIVAQRMRETPPALQRHVRIAAALQYEIIASDSRPAYAR
jgi:hypothetical protein